MGKIQVRLLFLAGTAAIVAAVVVALNSFGGGGEPPSAALAQLPGPDTVDAGYDLFETEGGTTDLLGISLGAGFFGPGSDPFVDQVYLEGVPFPDYTPPGGPTYTGLLPTDTIVERHEDAGEEGFPDLVPIEIVALNLKSVDPITVYYGGVSPQQWDLTLVVPENDPLQVPGSMTVRHEYATGGTFDSSLPVDPLLTFTEVGGPGVEGPDYHSTLFGGPIQFEATGVPWNHTANPLASPAGHSVIVKEGLSSNFFPGIDGTSGDLYKGYFTLDDPVLPALHTVQPAERPGPFGTTVGDCNTHLSMLPPGEDTFQSTADVQGSIDPDGPGGLDPIDLGPLNPFVGETTVSRGPPHTGPTGETVIPIEIIAMNLVAGPVTIYQDPYPGFESVGEMSDIGGGLYDIDSFFDVYIMMDVNVPPVQTFSSGPVRMEATIERNADGEICVPPFEVDFSLPFGSDPVPIMREAPPYDQVGDLIDATHTPEPPRSITTIKLDGVTEEPLAGAVFTLHDGYGCNPPAVDATTTDETGVGDLGPMGSGMYSVQEVIPPEGSELPSDTCTDVDHTVSYQYLEVIDGGPDLEGGLDYFPSNAKFIFEGLPLPDLDYVVLNGQAQVSRSALTGDVIDTEIVSLELTGNHPVVGPVTVTAGYGLGSSSLPASTGAIENVVHDGVNLTGGDSFFDVYVEVTVGGLTLVNQESPIHVSSTIDQLPPELDFFDNAFVSVLLNDWPSLDPAGEIDYTLWVPLPRGELDVIIQDPPGPPEHISYSIEFNGPSNYAGFHAADILVPGPSVVRTCASLGLSGNGCAFATPQDDMNSLSYGYDFSSANPAEPPKVFSVDAPSLGLLGTDVDIERTCSTGAEAHADLFRTPLNNTNQQEFDGNGAAGAPDPTCLSSYPLGLVEPLAPPTGDNLNALGELPTGDPVYFTLAPNSPSLLPTASGGLGLCGGSSCTSAHIFKSTGGTVSIYATPGDLGLVSGDIINALALRESDGLFDVAPADGVFDDPPDLLQFSLAPGSPSLVGGLDSAADQFKPKTTVGGSRVLVTPANAHGLMDALDMGPHGDNLDAIKAPYLDGDGDGVPDFIGTGGGDFNDGTISGNITGDLTLTGVADMVQVDGGGGGGGASATCPATGDSAETDISLTLAGGEIAQIGCESSASVTIVNGPASVGFGPFTAIVPTGSKVIIRELPSPAAGPCPETVPTGAYQIVHSVGTLDVIISSPSMSPPVSLPPGSVYRDCDADDIMGVMDNCPDNANSSQENTDVDNAIAGFLFGGAPLPGDADGDVCDTDDDNDSWTDADEQAIYGVGPGSAEELTPCRTASLDDPWPPDVFGSGGLPDRIVNFQDLNAMVPKLFSGPPGPPYDVRFDLYDPTGAFINFQDLNVAVPVLFQGCAPPP